MTRIFIEDIGSDIHLVGQEPMGVRYGGALLPRKSWSCTAEDRAAWLPTLQTLAEAFKTNLPDGIDRPDSGRNDSDWCVVSPSASALVALLLLAREGDGSGFSVGLSVNRFATRVRDVCAHDWTALLDAGVRVRISAQRCRTGLAIAIRKLPSKITDLDGLGFGNEILPRLKDLARRERGIILCCGAVNSGKSTTVNAMVEYGNRMEPRKVVSNEDPVEHCYSKFGSQARALSQLREVGEDVPSFAMGLEQGLRQDAQCLVVGEIRTQEPLEAALRASQSGHLVYASLHATGCVAALDRIALCFAPEKREQGLSVFGANLAAILYQTLRRTGEFADSRRSASHAAGGQIVSHEAVVSHGKGAMIGRRRLAYEFMEGTSDIKSLIRHYAVQGAAFRLASFYEELQRPPHVLFLRNIAQMRADIDPQSYDQAVAEYKADNPY